MLTSVTLGTARSEVRALLAENNPAFWTNAQLNSWINQGCGDIARRAEVLWEEYSVTTIPNQQSYVFPADFLVAHRCTYTINPPYGQPGAQSVNLEWREINAMDENWGMIQSLPAAWPRWYTIRASAAMGGYFLMTYPAPAAAGQLIVYYYRQAHTVANDNDLIDMLPGWENIVYDYACYKALRAAQYPNWREAYQLYEAELVQMIDRTRTMTDQNATISSGQATWPVYAYADPSDIW